jgi:hypothetical protein
MKVTPPETSTGNEHHRRGKKLTNQTQGRAPKKGSDSTRRSHEGGSTSSRTDERTPQRRHKITPQSELVTKKLTILMMKVIFFISQNVNAKRPLTNHLAAHAQGR